jgi:hypothetical protein
VHPPPVGVDHQDIAVGPGADAGMRLRSRVGRRRQVTPQLCQAYARSSPGALTFEVGGSIGATVV